ncbi:hypothetical protein HanRHA438_Chr02g0094231 [Helianthus annuus]|nr:hypothetical protein HanRHA438_Chr02g0094231 [Helianthus annuus]
MRIKLLQFVFDNLSSSTTWKRFDFFNFTCILFCIMYPSQTLKLARVRLRQHSLTAVG